MHTLEKVKSSFYLARESKCKSNININLFMKNLKEIQTFSLKTIICQLNYLKMQKNYFHAHVKR